MQTYTTIYKCIRIYTNIQVYTRNWMFSSMSITTPSRKNHPFVPAKSPGPNSFLICVPLTMTGMLPDALPDSDVDGCADARAFSGSAADGGAGSLSLCLFVALLDFRNSPFISRLSRGKQGD